MIDETESPIVSRDYIIFPKSYFLPPFLSLSLSLFGAHMVAIPLMRNYERLNLAGN